MGKDQDFFIQPAPRELWHVESDDDCEVMLCGLVVPVDNEMVRIQYRWGPRKCPDCFIRYEARKRDGN